MDDPLQNIIDILTGTRDWTTEVPDRIAAQLQAAGLIDNCHGLPSASNFCGYVKRAERQLCPHCLDKLAAELNRLTPTERTEVLLHES